MEEYRKFNKAKLACSACDIWKSYKRVVGSEGNGVNPDVVVIGEAPRIDEVRRRRPFIGKSGQLLRRTMRPCGYTKLNTLITNTIPCRPFDNKYPDDLMMVHNCMNRWLWKELDLLKPKFVLLLGSKALQAVLKLEGITKHRGTWLLLERSGFRAECLPTFHPSHIIRSRNSSLGHQKTASFLADVREVAAAAGFPMKDTPIETECHINEVG